MYQWSSWKIPDVKVKVTLRLTVSQSVSQSWCRAPEVLSWWGALSDEKTGLSFVRVIVYSNKSFATI
jgi:hypothetical protein